MIHNNTFRHLREKWVKLEEDQELALWQENPPTLEDFLDNFVGKSVSEVYNKALQGSFTATAKRWYGVPIAVEEDLLSELFNDIAHMARFKAIENDQKFQTFKKQVEDFFELYEAELKLLRKEMMDKMRAALKSDNKNELISQAREEHKNHPLVKKYIELSDKLSIMEEEAVNTATIESGEQLLQASTPHQEKMVQKIYDLWHQITTGEEIKDVEATVVEKVFFEDIHSDLIGLGIDDTEVDLYINNIEEEGSPEELETLKAALEQTNKEFIEFAIKKDIYPEDSSVDEFISRIEHSMDQDSYQVDMDKQEKLKQPLSDFIGFVKDTVIDPDILEIIDDLVAKFQNED